MSAEGLEAWQRRDPWQLLSCLPDVSAKEDCSASYTDTLQPVQSTKHQGQPELRNTYSISSRCRPLHQEGGNGG